MTEATPRHIPVMQDRTIELLTPALSRPGAVIVDATLGLGGHSEALLDTFPELTVLGLDRDPAALARAGERLSRFGSRFTSVHTVYDELPEALEAEGYDHADGILFDLGVSSMQLDEVERGFSYSKDAPLDMRMDSTAQLTAEHILATYSAEELARIFRDYGEERLAPKYAAHIVAARDRAPLTSSAQLVEIITAATPVAVQRKGHPAKRVFQALRIEVNGELAALERAIPRALSTLSVGGRMVVLSYQSLEDRFIKRTFARMSQSSSPRGLPVELPSDAAELALLVRGAELATPTEQELNPRSIPVRLRAVERIRSVS